MKLSIYGSGCAKCGQLQANAEAAAKQLGLSYDIEKITDVSAIIDAGIMRTPALAIDGDIVLEGSTGNAEQLTQLLAEKG